MFDEFTSGEDAKGFFLPQCTLDIYLASGSNISADDYKVLYDTIVETQLRETPGPGALAALLDSLQALLRPYKLKCVDIPLRAAILWRDVGRGPPLMAPSPYVCVFAV